MGGAARQLPLSFDHRPALDAADFVVAGSNTAAVAWLDRWPDWPGRALAIHGPAASGKTHLAHVWRHRSGANVIDGSSLTSTNVAEVGGPDHRVVVEDADRGVDEAALFHLINLVREEGGSVLLTGRDAPARWPVRLPDLSSRLAAMPAVGLEAPDDGLLVAVLAKQFDDRQLRIGDGVVEYLLPRIERSFAAISRVVAGLDKLSLAERRNITVPLARQVLEEDITDTGDPTWTSD